MQTTARFFLLALALSLSACGAQWEMLSSHEEDARFAEGTDGHRDFPRGFEEVWPATIAGLHASGIAVPQSVVPAENSVTIDLDSLWVFVTEESSGRTCVMLRFNGMSEQDGRDQAASVLDRIQQRLR
ncbi:MAG: hypothetical protein ACI8X5_002267 [Planctomycetota bacterium]|jgi:hypothetical protein